MTATRHTERMIGQEKVSRMLPFLKSIASEWNLNLSRVRDWKIAVRIFKNSIKNN
jgi:hypothetical protein